MGEKSKRTRIVILGGGFGGLYAALYLDRTIAGDPNVEVTLLDREMVAGALASEAKLNPSWAVGLAVSACLAADWIWFNLGKRGASPVLNLLNRSGIGR